MKVQIVTTETGPIISKHCIGTVARNVYAFIPTVQYSRVQLKCDGTRGLTGGKVKGKLANGVGSQYPSHYLGTWCIQHYYR